MKISKKLKICVAFAMLAAITLTTTVAASSSYIQKVDYSKPTAYRNLSMEDKFKELKKNCQLSLYDYYDRYDDIDSAILSEISTYCDMGWEIYDLKSAADILNTGLECRPGYVFNNGIWITDDVTHPSVRRFVCKCTENDFKEYVKYNIDNNWTYEYDARGKITTYTRSTGLSSFTTQYDAEWNILTEIDRFNNYGRP